jgi:hypothetical protein
MEFKNVIIWGHFKTLNTYSYIQGAFFRACEEMGFNTLWLEDTEDNAKIANNIGAAIYITEGQTDKFIPLRNDSAYVTHNCVTSKYEGMRRLGIQVFTNQDPITSESLILSPVSHYEKSGKLLFFPWATDLLPREFDFDNVLTVPKENNVYWIGTIARLGPFENISEITPFDNNCYKNGIQFKQVSGVSTEENKLLINKSYIAPTIVGKWQKQVGFIPCRIFKNMSYGELGVTNSETISKIFGDLIVYEPDTSSMLVTVGAERYNKDRIIEGMKFVQKNHTYINRMEDILKVL